MGETGKCCESQERHTLGVALAGSSSGDCWGFQVFGEEFFQRICCSDFQACCEHRGEKTSNFHDIP